MKRSILWFKYAESMYPVIYHHIQFPYTDVDKFKKRAHRLLLFGLIPTAVTLYLGMALAFSPLLDNLAYFVLPFVFVYILYRMRKYNRIVRSTRLKCLLGLFSQQASGYILNIASTEGKAPAGYNPKNISMSENI